MLALVIKNVTANISKNNNGNQGFYNPKRAGLKNGK